MGPGNITITSDDHDFKLKMIVYQIESASGGAKVVHYDDTKAMLADPELMACVICTPTFTHKNIILQCLQAGLFNVYQC